MARHSLSETREETGKGLLDRLIKGFESRGGTQVELAAKVGVASGSISDIMSGKTMPKADLLVRLALALEVHPAWLLFGVGAPDDPLIQNLSPYEVGHRDGVTEGIRRAYETLGDLLSESVLGQQREGQAALDVARAVTEHLQSGENGGEKQKKKLTG